MLICYPLIIPPNETKFFSLSLITAMFMKYEKNNKNIKNIFPNVIIKNCLAL